MRTRYNVLLDIPKELAIASLDNPKRNFSSLYLSLNSGRSDTRTLLGLPIGLLLAQSFLGTTTFLTLLA